MEGVNAPKEFPRMNLNNLDSIATIGQAIRDLYQHCVSSYQWLQQDIENDKMMFTKDGGLAIKYVASGDIVVGEIVHPVGTNTVTIAPAGDFDPIGVCYKAATHGKNIWIVTAGLGYVKVTDGGTAVVGDILYLDSTEDGRADYSPTVPATTDHFREVGHVLKPNGDDLLALAVLHFN